MNTGIIGVLAGALGVTVLLLAGAAAYLLRRGRSANISVASTVRHMRAIGHLSVFKALTKEIVTETDHAWGEFGSKYMQWVLTNKKMAMIFEFEIDFRYDLRRPEFAVVSAADGSSVISMPPCFYEARIRDIRFYDEQRSRLVPWLLPDLLNGFLPGGFSEEDKNRLVKAAKSHAEKHSAELIASLQSEVQNSAKATMMSIAKAFGVDEVAFEFAPQGEIRLSVDMTGGLAA